MDEPLPEESVSSSLIALPSLSNPISFLVDQYSTFPIKLFTSLRVPASLYKALKSFLGVDVTRTPSLFGA